MMLIAGRCLGWSGEPEPAGGPPRGQMSFESVVTASACVPPQSVEQCSLRAAVVDAADYSADVATA